jgi:hypothetical protein
MSISTYHQGLWRYAINTSKNRVFCELRTLVGINSPNVINFPPLELWNKIQVSKETTDSFIICIPADLIRDRTDERVLSLYVSITHFKLTLSAYFEEFECIPLLKTSHPTLQIRNEIGTSKEVQLKKRYLSAQTLMSHVPLNSSGDSASTRVIGSDNSQVLHGKSSARFLFMHQKVNYTVLVFITGLSLSTLPTEDACYAASQPFLQISGNPPT